MSWSKLKLIFLRELRDQLRDRRTLFMILVMPFLLYPGIGIGMGQFWLLFAEQPRQVVVRGIEYLPAQPPLVVGDGFEETLFGREEDASLLKIVPDVHAETKLESGELQAILIVPPDIRQRIESGQEFSWQPHYNSADDKSRFASLLLREVLDNWMEQIVRSRIHAKGLPTSFAHPFKVAPHDIASEQQRASGMIWAKLFPFLLVIMALTGAFYPAVDLCAGEKERGTIETLLISPAARSEIVLGKFLTICLFSMATALLNLASMAATGWVITRQLVAALPSETARAVIAPPSLISGVWMFLLLVPLVAFFSALSIALAAFARSSKEGQYYLTPLFLLTMPLVLVVVMPGTELNAFYSMIPISGPALLLKALIQEQYDLALEFLVPVLLPTLLYAVLALRWAIEQFSREDVLFREAERLDLWLWARHLLRDRQPLPSAAEAMFCYGIMLLLVWFVGGFLGPPADADPSTRQRILQRVLIVMQIAFIASPSLIMAVMLTSRPRQTLLLRRTPWLLLAVAAVLAVVLHPITVEASHQIQRGLPAQPKWIEDHFAQMFAGTPLWWQLCLIALLPAVCEELAFRGFILSGLMRRMSPATAVIVSGFLFGFYHMNPHQLLTATVLGWILGIIATRSGSLVPGMCFHFVHNALVVLLKSFQDGMESSARQGGESGAWGWLFGELFRQPFAASVSYDVPYRLRLLLPAALLATALLTWLLKQPVRAPRLEGESAGMDRTDGATAHHLSGRAAGGMSHMAAPDFGTLSRDARDATS